MAKKIPIFDKKNVLVTGGAGFIGSHVCEKLLENSHVICLDDLSNSSIDNIEHLLQNPDFEFIQHDINTPLTLSAFEELQKFKIEFQGVQEIYHLACPTSAKNFDAARMKTLLSNSMGMIHVLNIARTYTAKFLLASTAVVYGPRTQGFEIFSEDTPGVVNQLSPRGCYDEGKRFAETCVATFSLVHGLDTKIARIFRTYGPRMKLYDGQMIPDFITNALEGKDLVIYSDKEFESSLCFVSDIIDGLVRLMAAEPGIGPVNLGSDQLYRLSKVAEKIIERTHSSSKIVYEAPLLFMAEQGIPDIKKAKERLGWFPVISLEDGIEKSIDYTIANKERLGLAI